MIEKEQNNVKQENRRYQVALLDIRNQDKKNLNKMNLIKKVHSLVEHSDLEKQRMSQDSVGILFGTKKDTVIRDVSIEGMHGEWISVDRAHMKKYVILYCHGGGFCTGSSLYARTLTTKLASTTCMDVLCFDYRLAPENPYPAAMLDAMKAWDYLMLLGYGAKDVVVAGDSAGGNMALSLVLKLKEEGRILPRGLILMSPWTDLTCSGKSHQTRAEVDPVLEAKYLRQVTLNYAKGENLQDPMISPLYGDFTGFPPTCIQVGDNEVLLNDATMLYKKMIRAEVPAKLEIFKGMWHVFQMSPLKKAYDAMDKNAEFIYDVCR